MLNKPGSTAASGVVRLKKTSTAGAISELAESRLRSNPGREDPGGKTPGGKEPGRRDPQWEGPKQAIHLGDMKTLS